MTTYSQDLRLSLIADGTQVGTWGDTTNANLGTLIEQAIAGVSGGPSTTGTYPSITMPSDANYALTANNGAVDQARNAVIVINSTPTLSQTRYIIAPAGASKVYIVKNNTSGSQAIAMSYGTTSAPTGAAVSVANGTTSIVYGDGTNFYGVSASGGGGGGSSIAINEQAFVATAGQTVFNLTSFTYTPGINSLQVYVNGLKQVLGEAYTETSTTSFTFVSGLNDGAIVEALGGAALAQSISALNVAYNEGGTGAVTTTVQAKLQQTVSVLDFGADPTGATDSQPAFQAAIAAGVTDLLVPAGTYRVNSSINIVSTDPIRNITGNGAVTIKLYTSTQSEIFYIQSAAPSYPTKQFLNISNLTLTSNGSSTDGLTTYGILGINCSYCQFNNISTSNFSGAGLELRGCVYVGIANFTGNSCFYGLSFQLNPAGSQCTSVRVDRAYISGCTRGVTQTGAVDMVFIALVMEYCGSSTTTDGALHLAGGIALIELPYFEANNRNIVSADAIGSVSMPYGWGTGTAADVFTYSGVSANQRGWTVSYGYNTYTPRINADTATNRDLVIGTNLTVPVAGGSVQFGNQTMIVASGTLTSATWTTVYTIPAAELGGSGVNLQAMYEYTCYAGSADLSTGFDSGTIMNNTLRSYSGTTPSWLRLSSNTVQMNVTSSSYGLNFKIVMRRIYPN